MSYISTYDKRTPKPKGMALAIAVHGIVIGAVIAMPGIHIDSKDWGEIEAIEIAPPEPEDQKVEEKEPEIPQPRENTVKPPLPPISDLPKAPETSPTEFAGGEGLSLGGSGEGIDTPFEPLGTIEPTPDPVIVDAKLNPRFAEQFQPRYPSGLLRLDIEGDVSVRVLVGTNGRAKDIQLLSSPHEGFWNATRKHALKKWRFKPATEDGKPVESWITLKVRFEINS